MSDKASGKKAVVNSPRLHNRFVDATNLVEQWRLGQGKTPLRGGPSQTSVRVKNLVGADLSRGSVVELGTYLPTVDTDTAIDPSTLWLQGNEYAANGRFGVVRDALKQNAFGECQLIGACLARVDFTDTAHRFCRPKVGETYFETSGNAGPVLILAKPSTGTGVQEAIVDLSPGRGMYLAKNGGSTIAARSGTTVSSGTVTLYYVSGTTLTSLGISVSAFNLSGTAVAADAWLNVAPEAGSGKWFVTWEDCT
jgi:hypothetical protein